MLTERMCLELVPIRLLCHNGRKRLDLFLQLKTGVKGSSEIKGIYFAKIPIVGSSPTGNSEVTFAAVESSSDFLLLPVDTADGSKQETCQVAAVQRSALLLQCRKARIPLEAFPCGVFPGT